MTFCESNPLHAPPVGDYYSHADPALDNIALALCEECLRWRIDLSLTTGEGFTVVATGRPYSRIRMPDGEVVEIFP